MIKKQLSSTGGSTAARIDRSLHTTADLDLLIEIMSAIRVM
jgi:hypothetical protein